MQLVGEWAYNSVRVKWDYNVFLCKIRLEPKEIWVAGTYELNQHHRKKKKKLLFLSKPCSGFSKCRGAKNKDIYNIPIECSYKQVI